MLDIEPVRHVLLRPFSQIATKMPPSRANIPHFHGSCQPPISGVTVQ
jgi:hypothetical protein